MSIQYPSFDSISPGEAFSLGCLKRIDSKGDVFLFQKSIAHSRITDFIKVLNLALPGAKLTDSMNESDEIRKILSVLDVVSSWIEEIPPEKGPKRFGNKAFQKWINRLENVYFDRKGFAELLRGLLGIFCFIEKVSSRLDLSSLK